MAKKVEKPTINVSKWKPTVGSIIPVHLPSEIIMGRVLSYDGDDNMTAVLDVQPPLSKAHGHFYKSKVNLERRKLQPAGEKWSVAECED